MRAPSTRSVGTQMSAAPTSLVEEVRRHGELFSMPIARPSRGSARPEIPLPGEASASYNVYVSRRSSGSSAAVRLEPGVRKYSSRQIAGESVQRRTAILAEVESGKAIVSEAPGCLVLPDRFDIMTAVTETSEPKAVPRIGVGTLITDAIKKIPSQQTGYVCTNVFGFACAPEDAQFVVCWRVRSFGSLPGFRADERRSLDLATDLVVAVLGADLIYPIYLAPSSAFGTSGFVPIVVDYSNVRSKASALSEYGMPGPDANSYAPYVQWVASVPATQMEILFLAAACVGLAVTIGLSDPTIFGAVRILPRHGRATEHMNLFFAAFRPDSVEDRNAMAAFASYGSAGLAVVTHEDYLFLAAIDFICGEDRHNNLPVRFQGLPSLRAQALRFAQTPFFAIFAASTANAAAAELKLAQAREEIQRNPAGLFVALFRVAEQYGVMSQLDTAIAKAISLVAGPTLPLAPLLVEVPGAYCHVAATPFLEAGTVLVPGLYLPSILFGIANRQYCGRAQTSKVRSETVEEPESARPSDEGVDTGKTY